MHIPRTTAWSSSIILLDCSDHKDEITEDYFDGRKMIMCVLWQKCSCFHPNCWDGIASGEILKADRWSFFHICIRRHSGKRRKEMLYNFSLKRSASCGTWHCVHSGVFQGQIYCRETVSTIKGFLRGKHKLCFTRVPITEKQIPKMYRNALCQIRRIQVKEEY